MEVWFRTRWRQIKRPLSVFGFIAVLVVAIALIFVEVRVYGTGFAGKTLWDWLQLLASLAIPIVVGFGAVWFTTRQGKVADAENKDNQRETALQAYIDKISELLLANRLSDSEENEEVRKIARVRTLTVLRSLDAERKGSVLQFLYESRLIEKGKNIIDLQGADLSDANLFKANLANANLTAANLTNANLTNAKLTVANLTNANLASATLTNTNLASADLARANLASADLTNADLTNANLFALNITTEELEKQANSLKGATMPDGSIHP
jgi:hypothetical protein